MIATNTKADATGEKIATTRSNMATITVTKKAVTYTVSYDWGTEFPEGESLPSDSREYQSVQDAEADMDTTYTNGFTSDAPKDGKDGTWTFSGWTARVEDTVVKFIGEWTFTETLKVDAEAPAPITLADASYEAGKTAEPLNGKTTVTDNGTITYQWYRTNAVDDFNGTLLDGEIGETFTPPTDAVGTQYYYVIATNTKADATGEKIATTRSNMATITVTKKAVTYTVSYDWGTEFPEGESLPSDSREYQSVQDAEADMDTTYTNGFTSDAPKDGKDGTWTFSGWTARVEDTVVRFIGEWTFVEKQAPVEPIDPQPPVTPPDRLNVVARPSVRPQAQQSRTELPFADVKANAWYRDAVEYLHENGIMSGVREDSFAPNRNTTRGMITTMLHRLEQEPHASAANPFLDAQYGYYANAVRWAQQEGIVTGTSDTRFSPNAPMTREQLAVVLYRYAQYLGRNTDRAASLNSYADGSTVSVYAREAMRWAVAEGLLSGVGNDRLAPGAPATRAQVAEILYRFLCAE